MENITCDFVPATMLKLALSFYYPGWLQQGRGQRFYFGEKHFWVGLILDEGLCFFI